MSSVPVKETSPYLQAPLDLNCESIRLVELQPGGLLDPIRCHLRPYAFQPQCPAYIALSYAWGPKEFYCTVELNGTWVPVGRNLWTFLYQMRARNQLGRFWIDAICIDQSNIEERNHQVQMMQQIYSSAQCVSIWLGDSDEKGLNKIAMAFLQNRRPLKETRKTTFRNWNEEYAMRHFCKNQYWRRMWIIQEVVLAVKATIYCCSYEVDWQCFTQLVSDAQVVVRYGYLPYHNGDAKEFLKSPAAVVARTKSEWSGGLLPLITLLPTFRHHEATDFRDKVYALRGLSVEISRIPVDYCISPEELLKQVVFEVCNSWPPDSRWTTASIKEFITTMGVMLEADHSNIDIKAVQLQRDNDLCRWPTYIEHPMFDRSKSETQPHVLTSIERNPLKLGQLWDFITTLLHRLTRLQPDILLNFYKPSIASFKLVARRPATKEALMLWREGLDVACGYYLSTSPRADAIKWSELVCCKLDTVSSVGNWALVWAVRCASSPSFQNIRSIPNSLDAHPTDRDPEDVARTLGRRIYAIRTWNIVAFVTKTDVGTAPRRVQETF